MRWNELGKFLIVALAIVGGFVMYIRPLASSVKQGLDLQGGTHVVLQAVDTPQLKVNDDALDRATHIIERRVNALGLTEPVVQRQGRDRIIVELPGVKDPEKAINMLGKTAMLEFKDPNNKTVLTGTDLKDAKAVVGNGNQPLVSMEFSDEGGQKFADVTARNVGKRIAITLDGEVLTAPVVQEAITGGRAQITGNRSMEEAQHLAILLRSGSLPVKLEIIENRTVGPTLGQDSKEASQKAFLIGVAGVFVFMILFYRLSGVVADIALLLYTMLLLLVMRYLNATLTLPGMAGIILSIGMAVDANVLIFERFKEEIRTGKTLRKAMDNGFGRALVTILDSNITTLMACAVLFYLGTGEPHGFWHLRSESRGGGKMKNFSIVRNWKIFFAITIIGLMIGYGSMIFRGFNLGIDFTGGSIMDLKFEKAVQVAQVREVLGKHNLGGAIIQLESNDSAATSSQGVLIRTPVIADNDRTTVMQDMEKSLGKFEIRRVENVGATIGGELIQQAAIAIFLSWVLMVLYITIRFQLNFALAAIIALIIDVSVTLSWFSLLQLEIDSTFVAALLTVVGYSVNGTIVIFDRIRENLKVHRRTETVTDMIDNSIKSTLTRTIYTTITTLFAIVAIFLFGGETIHNFSFAMLVGCCSGAYTSILLAGTIWLFLQHKKAGE